MINWEKVRAYFCLNLEVFSDELPLNETLYCLLDYYYNVKKLSWRQIAKITDGYISYRTLMEKARQLGIKIRVRGGPNNVKKFDLTKEEYEKYSSHILGKMKRVCHTVILRKARKLGFKIRSKGRRSRDSSVQDEVFDNGQESH